MEKRQSLQLVTLLSQLSVVTSVAEAMSPMGPCLASQQNHIPERVRVRPRV